jgi:nucleoid-associated protein YgaU
MPVRYDNRRILLNKDELYEKFMDKRGVKAIRQWSTGRFNYPTVQDLRDMSRSRHIWKAGDRYYKLAIDYYGSAQYWWVIALFNQKPTESDVKPGDVINIPLPLEAILRVYDR